MDIQHETLHSRWNGVWKIFRQIVRLSLIFVLENFSWNQFNFSWKLKHFSFFHTVAQIVKIQFHRKNVKSAQCDIFYVKSLLRHPEVQKLSVFATLEALKFVNFLKFCLQKVQKMTKIKIQSLKSFENGRSCTSKIPKIDFT